MKFKLPFLIVILLVVACVQPKPRKPIVQKSSSILNQSVNLNKQLIAEQEALFKNYMEADSLSTYKNSALGFWYKVNTNSNETYLPNKGDEVFFQYEISTINNEIIYSFDEIGTRNYFVDEQEIVEGFRDGLKLMNQGDDYTFLFPSHKVYGYVGDQNKIEINQPLIVNVKLIKINKANENN